MMFLPLSLATLGPVPKRDIAASSGFYNLTRQLGGSLGIAIITALVTRRDAFHETVLAEKVTPYNHAAMERVSQMTAAFQASSGDPNAAHGQALTALQQIIHAQAGILTFADVFRYVGIAFIVTLPLLFLLGRGGNEEAAANAH
jgi:DHA2 family multidrug resistance protein